MGLVRYSSRGLLPLEASRARGSLLDIGDAVVDVAAFLASSAGQLFALMCCCRQLASALCSVELEVAPHFRTQRGICLGRSPQPQDLLRALTSSLHGRTVFRCRRLRLDVTNICKPVTSDDPEAWGRPFDLRAAEFVESAMALQQLQPAFGAFLRSLELEGPLSSSYGPIHAPRPDAVFSLAWLSGDLPQLTTLTVRGLPVASLAALASLPALEQVHFDLSPLVTAFSDEELMSLDCGGVHASPVQLQQLQRAVDGVSDFEALSGITTLRSLQLSRYPRGVRLPAMPQLRRLRVVRSCVLDLAPLEAAQRLEVLELHSCHGLVLHFPPERAALPSLEPLARLRDLRFVSLRCASWDLPQQPPSLTALTRCRHLEELDVRDVGGPGTWLDDGEAVAALCAAWPGLHTLRLGSTAAMTRQLWRLRWTAPRLTCLDVSAQGGRSPGLYAGLLELAGLPELRELDLSDAGFGYPYGRAIRFGLAPILSKFAERCAVHRSMADSVETLRALRRAEGGTGLGGVPYQPDHSALLLEVCHAGLSPGHMYEDAAARWPSAASLRAAEAAPIDISALRSVLAEGAYPNCSDAFGHTPLFLALLHDSADAIALLLAAQADVHLRPWDRVRMPPIFWAVRFDRLPLARQLATAGAEPYAWMGDDGRHCHVLDFARQLGRGEEWRGFLRHLPLRHLQPRLRPADERDRLYDRAAAQAPL